MKSKFFFAVFLLLLAAQITHAQWLTTGTNIYYNKGNVGIGTNTPASRLHILNGGIRITPTTDYEALRFTSGQADFTAFRHVTNSDGAIFEMNVQPAANNLNSVYRFFRLTNTTGVKVVDFFRGNGNLERSARIGVDGQNSYFQVHGGNFGIGTSTPDYKLSVAGAVEAESSLAYFNATSLGRDANVLTLQMTSLPFVLSGQKFLECLNQGQVVAKIDRSGNATFESTSVNKAEINGIDNDGTSAALSITSGEQKMLLDGNEIDGVTEGLYLNHNTNQNVVIAGGGGKVGIGTSNPNAKLHVDGDFRLQSPNNHTFSMGVNNNGDLEFRGDNNSVKMVIGDVTGSVGIGTLSPEAKLHVVGRTKTKELEIEGGSDIAENFDILGAEKSNEIMPGMLVSIHSDYPGQLKITDCAYDNKVAGIISGANGIKTGLYMGQKGSEADGRFPVALAGRVYVFADASTGAIEAGDLLTSSPVPGHVMKAKKTNKAKGAIVGKAMTPLKAGKGFVLVLVNLQ